MKKAGPGRIAAGVEQTDRRSQNAVAGRSCGAAHKRIKAEASGPRHVAIIMDGNARWAQSRKLGTAEGHEAGLKALVRIVRSAVMLQIPYLTVFSFSTENWQRKSDEVKGLIQLIRNRHKKLGATLDAEGAKVRVIGTRAGISTDLLAIMAGIEAKTRHNTRIHLQIAFNYGGRDEILRACRRFAGMVADGSCSIEDCDEASFSDLMDTRGLPDPDLVIRTSGEQRTSNFLAWQSVYAEYVFSDVLWPDFTALDLQAAIRVFNGRERRYGRRAGAT